MPGVKPDGTNRSALTAAEKAELDGDVQSDNAPIIAGLHTISEGATEAQMRAAAVEIAAESPQTAVLVPTSTHVDMQIMRMVGVPGDALVVVADAEYLLEAAQRNLGTPVGARDVFSLIGIVQIGSRMKRVWRGSLSRSGPAGELEFRLFYVVGDKDNAGNIALLEATTTAQQGEIDQLDTEVELLGNSAQGLRDDVTPLQASVATLLGHLPVVKSVLPVTGGLRVTLTDTTSSMIALNAGEGGADIHATGLTFQPINIFTGIVRLVISRSDGEPDIHADLNVSPYVAQQIRAEQTRAEAAEAALDTKIESRTDHPDPANFQNTAAFTLNALGEVDQEYEFVDDWNITDFRHQRNLIDGSAFIHPVLRVVRTHETWVGMTVGFGNKRKRIDLTSLPVEPTERINGPTEGRRIETDLFDVQRDATRRPEPDALDGTRLEPYAILHFTGPGSAIFAYDDDTFISADNRPTTSVTVDGEPDNVPNLDIDISAADYATRTKDGNGNEAIVFRNPSSSNTATTVIRNGKRVMVSGQFAGGNTDENSGASRGAGARSDIPVVADADGSLRSMFLAGFGSNRLPGLLPDDDVVVEMFKAKNTRAADGSFANVLPNFVATGARITLTQLQYQQKVSFNDGDFTFLKNETLAWRIIEPATGNAIRIDIVSELEYADEQTVNIPLANVELEEIGEIPAWNGVAGVFHDTQIMVENEKVIGVLLGDTGDGKEGKLIIPDMNVLRARRRNEGGGRSDTEMDSIVAFGWGRRDDSFVHFALSAQGTLAIALGVGVQFETAGKVYRFVGATLAPATTPLVHRAYGTTFNAHVGRSYAVAHAVDFAALEQRVGPTEGRVIRSGEGTVRAVVEGHYPLHASLAVYIPNASTATSTEVFLQWLRTRQGGAAEVFERSTSIVLNSKNAPGIIDFPVETDLRIGDRMELQAVSSGAALVAIDNNAFNQSTLRVFNTANT